MRLKTQVGAIVGSLVLLVIGTMYIWGSGIRDPEVCKTQEEPVYTKPLYLRTIPNKGRENEKVITLQDTLKYERDELSKELNQLKMQLGKMDCEKSAHYEAETSSSGGWCRKTSLEDGGQHITDEYLVTSLSNFLKDKVVGSFGDGPGAYKREIEKLGEVKSYDAYDGAPYGEETSEGRVKFMDLTVPQYGLPMYDWIISVEVAEHIPKEYEPVYIDNIVRHCKEGIILSWAVPGQGGLAHINNRPFEYVVDLMTFQGFTHDELSSRSLQESASFEWLRDNINVFRRVNTTDFEFNQQWFT